MKRFHIPWIITIETNIGWPETVYSIFRKTLFSRVFWRSLRRQRGLTREKFDELLAKAKHGKP